MSSWLMRACRCLLIQPKRVALHWLSTLGRAKHIEAALGAVLSVSPAGLVCWFVQQTEVVVPMLRIVSWTLSGTNKNQPVSQICTWWLQNVKNDDQWAAVECLNKTLMTNSQRQLTDSLEKLLNNAHLLGELKVLFLSNHANCLFVCLIPVY